MMGFTVYLLKHEGRACDGTARFSSPLNVMDFVKFINVIKADEALLKKVGFAASIMAISEGLEAHARAIEMRLGRKKR